MTRTSHVSIGLLLVLLIASSIVARLEQNLSQDSAAAALQANAPETVRHRHEVTASPSAMGPLMFSSRPKAGLTIWGVQPGDDLDELVESLPAGCTYEQVSDYNNGSELKFRLSCRKRGQTLNVFVSPQTREVTRIGVFPVPPTFCVERNGVTILGAKDSMKTAESIIEAEEDLSLRKTENGLDLVIRYTWPARMESAVLKKE